MSKYTSLKNHFLIAMPHLDDPDFSRAVIYICDHTEEGAMGLIVNQPMKMSLNDVFISMGIEDTIVARHVTEQPVYSGGPVQRERGFVLHRPTRKRWQASFQLSQSLSITTSRDILESMAKNKAEVESLITLGYAGWEAGQLESEIKETTWLCCPADAELIFNTPPIDRWRAATKLMGFQLEQLSFEAGHA